jgi:hypothetical protein
LPVYEPNPNTCPVGSYTYELQYLDSGSFPSFISQYPTTEITIQTQDTTNLGLNHFKVIATESISGLSNDEALKNVFVFCQVTSLSYNIGDFPQEILYSPSFGIVQYTLPLFNMSPVRCTTSYSIEIVPQFGSGEVPSWISISNDGTKLVLSSTDTSITGNFAFRLRATGDEVMNEDLVFNVNFSCKISFLTLGQFVKSFSFYINQDG